MLQIGITRFGGPDRLTVEQAVPPEPGEGELRIRVAAAGVNRADLLQRAGRYPPPPGASPVLGLEVSGTVDALGPGASGFSPGEPVCALVPGGGYAEYVVAPAAHCLPVPEGLGLVEAAAYPEAVFTVWSNVFERGRLAAGEWLLVHGGAGGIGTAAIRMAKAFGAHVIATAGGPERAAVCRTLGADHAIDDLTEDFEARIKEITAGRGADVILDIAGGDYVARHLRALAIDGRLVHIAFLHGSKVEADLMPVMTKRLTITGSTLRAQSNAAKAAIAEAVRRRVWPLVASGAVRLPVGATFPLTEAAQAHRLMESRAHIGKILLIVGAVAQPVNPPPSPPVAR
jgi:NADPH:quinone reductase